MAAVVQRGQGRMCVCRIHNKVSKGREGTQFKNQSINQSIALAPMLCLLYFHPSRPSPPPPSFLSPPLYTPSPPSNPSQSINPSIK